MATKQDSRRFIQERVKDHKPLPDQKEIRLELGWDLIEAERKLDLPLQSEQQPKID